jgi:hypothetical protein
MGPQKLLGLITTLISLACAANIVRAQDPLPSWNDGPAKQAIMDFVRETTESGGAKFVSPEERIATFDQDGTCGSSIRCTRK